METRRPSMRKTRLRTQNDINEWVASNRTPLYALPLATEEEEELHVHFVDRKAEDTLSTSETTSSEDSDEVQPIALDGGYGWVIVLLSFCIHLICDGLSFSFGIIFPDIQKTFDSSKFGASIVASFYLAIPLLAGPIAGTLTDIYDCRATTILGGAIATFGVTMAYIGPTNIWNFAIFFGIVTGFGLCFCYNSGIVIVTYYFEKKRALATALAVCGSGAGTFIFPPLIELVLTKGGFWSTIVCYGFFFMLLIILGIVMKDVEWPNETQEYKKKKFLRKLDKMKEDRESVRNADLVGFNALLPIRESAYAEPRRALSLPVIPSFADDYLRKIEQSSSILSIRQAVLSLQDSVARSKSFGMFRSPAPRVLPTVPEYSMLNTKLEHLDLQTSHSPNATVTSKSRVRMYSNCSMSMDALDQIEQRQALADEESSSSDSELSNDGDSSSSELSDKILTKRSNQPKEVSIIAPATNGPATLLTIESGPPPPKPILKKNLPQTITQSARGMRTSMGGFTHSRVPASNATGLRYVALREPMFRTLQTKVPSAPTLFVKKKKKRTLREVLHLKQLISTVKDTSLEYWRLATDLRFTAYNISIFLLYMFYDIPYVNWPEFTNEHLGVPLNETSWLVSGIGLFNLISMVICGIVCDTPWARKNLFMMYGVMISLCGGCLVASTLVTTYMGMLVTSLLYGFFIAANYVLASVLLCELLHVSDFQNGYGFLSMAQGLGNLIGPALVGWVRDISQSYQYMFLVGAVGMILSGVIVAAIHFTLEDDDESSSEGNSATTKKASKKSSVVDSPVTEQLLSKNGHF
ncbi:unnamed protein product, partial [Mesorhabditis belari]|uniref:Major facilitator superfamily (MFS) profile domain-containing protein n=1 Tax=Mesorhabditis belari TaxID=2138241 RepID=A0AAF3EH39_9BILA